MKPLFKIFLLIGLTSTIFMTGCTSSATYEPENEAVMNEQIENSENKNLGVFELLEPHMTSYKEWKSAVTNNNYSENNSGVNLYQYYDRNYRDLFSSSFISAEEQEFLYNAILNKDSLALKNFYQRNKDVSYHSLGEKVDFSFLSEATDNFSKDLNFDMTYEDFKESCFKSAKNWSEYYNLDKAQDLADKLNDDLDSYYRSLFLVELAQDTLKVTLDEYSQVTQKKKVSYNNNETIQINCLNCNDSDSVIVNSNKEDIVCSECSFKYVKASCPKCNGIVIALPNSDFGVCLKCDGFTD